MKLQQMAFMLIAVTLFFALVGMFFITIFISDIRQSAEELQEREALLLVSKLANSPELACGSAYGSTKLSCIDEEKAMALRNSEPYSNFWGVDGIEIKRIYPEKTGLCTIENYPDCSEIVILENEGNGVGVSNFVALCRNENDGFRIQEKCDLGRIIVYYE